MAGGDRLHKAQAEECMIFFGFSVLFHCFMMYLYCFLAVCDIFHTPTA